MKRERPDEVLRGQMYYANLDPVIGSEQGGTRPVLVIQNNVGNSFSPTIIIAPITTRVKKLRRSSASRKAPWLCWSKSERLTRAGWAIMWAVWTMM